MTDNYFTSDWHFSHRNITGPSISSWSSGYRTFGTMQEHDATIVELVNETVPKTANLYFLGDLTFKSSEFIKKMLDQLDVENIHWILGNHDSVGHKLFKRVLTSGTSVLKDFHTKIKTLGNYAEIKIKLEAGGLESQLAKHLIPSNIILSHYPIGSWNGAYKGTWHLHGHSHNSYKTRGKILDVGIDSAYEKLGEYRPFSFEEVASYLIPKPINFVDHHDDETN